MVQNIDNQWKILMDYYRHENDILFNSYNLMGMLLDEKLVKRRIEELQLDCCYIYGAGFLGIQCYKAINKYIKVQGLVDKKGVLKFDVPEISCMNISDFQRIYQGEKVIITPVQFISEIHQELLDFIPDKQQIFLGEFIQSCA